MSLVKAVTIHQSTSGDAKDDVANSLYFGTGPGDDSPATLALIADAVHTFWHSNSGGATAVLDTWLSSTLDRTKGRRVAMYVKEPGERLFGSPRAISDNANFSAATSANSLVQEASVCLSFHGDLTDVPEEAGLTRPAARRRGRIFVGPLHTGAASSAAGAPARPHANLLERLRVQAEGLRQASIDAAEWSWLAVHAVDTDAWTSVPVVAGWVDNEFDTQRRRQWGETGRTEW